MKTTYPRHWRRPTPDTLKQHLVGKEQGLAPAGAQELRIPADTVIDIEGNRDIRRIDAKLRAVVEGMRANGYPVSGLDATQIGESVRLALVPHPTLENEMLTLVNGSIEDHPGVPLGPLVPHGCHSGHEAFVKLRVPKSHTLRGYDIHGEPIEIDRTGFPAIVDRHELWHEMGRRAADIAVENNVQIDWRPPEYKQDYRDFFDGPDGYGQNPHLPDWRFEYPPDQWLAVKVGEFVLMHFINNE